MSGLTISNAKGESIELAVLSVPSAPNRDSWVKTCVEIKCGSFHGRVEMSFVLSELVELRKALQLLYDNVKGNIDFKTVEGQFQLKMQASKTGQIVVSGELQDKPELGNRFHFELDMDQTMLLPALQGFSSLKLENK